MTVLVLLPGMDGSGTLFAAFSAALGTEIAPTVISYPADQSLGYAGLVEFVRTRLPSDAPFFLLGESFSSPIAIALAAERPPMLAGLILSGGFARNPVPPMRALRHLVRFAPLHGRFSRFASPLLLGWRASAGLRRALRSALDMASAPVLRMRMWEVLDVDYSERARTIAVPVLYLQADRDRVVFAAPARHLRSLLPEMKVVRLRGPHLLLQTAPVQAAAAVTAFIDATV